MTIRLTIFIICFFSLHAGLYAEISDEKSLHLSEALSHKEFNNMIFEGIIDSLDSYDLSNEEMLLLKNSFSSHIDHIYGSLNEAEQLFESEPETFEEKYLTLFISLKKDLIENRRISNLS